ncbi:MAG: transposase [Candidatus Andersenbacteria bacterium]|nr:transposase [Candidatus Andersenbacteria bacterium]
MTAKKLARLALRPKIFHTLTGLTPPQFITLLARLRPHWEAAEYTRKNHRQRKRAVGAGAKPKLDLSGDLFMTLLFYRTYVGQVFLGVVMGLDDSNVSRRIRRLEPSLQKVFRIPERRVDLSQEEILALIVDATEQETERRKGTRFSGKKYRQTIKTQIHITPDGFIKAVSKSTTGNTHDKRLYDQSQTWARGPDGRPAHVKTHADLGYIGTACVTPCKKPRSRPLMMHELYVNKQLAPKRIGVEHAIAHLKQFQVLSQRFRHQPNRYNLMFRNVAGLRNFIRTS